VTYQHFQQAIPNGDRVPDPAQDDVFWQGVGHNNANGGGANNIFGLDFKANDFKWDKCLCETDSDSDGKSNGEELGDPDCTWTPGQTPSRSNDLSHPGICEPLDTTKCMEINKDILFWSAEPFDCPATKEPDVKATTYRFPPTEVPAEVTSYLCMFFYLDIPEGTSEHLIAYEPIVDNEEVMHHSVMYGCLANQSDILANKTNGRVVDCEGAMAECMNPLVIWKVGLNGQCHPDNIGTLIGEGSFTGIWLEQHWNNPLGKPGLTDSSGLKIYHTPNKRTNDAAYSVWGASTLEIPYGAKNVLQTGGCLPECTEDFNEETVYISQIIPQMHYLGRAMTVTINGHLVLEDRTYSYESPKIYDYDPPLELKRGDEVRVNCTFTTTSALQWTFHGHAANDEMCYAIPLIYPMDTSIPSLCNEADGYGYCNKIIGDMGDCDITEFWFETDWMDVYNILDAKCDPVGFKCWEECPDAIERVGEMVPCFAGGMAKMMRGALEKEEFVAIPMYLLSCEEVVYDPKMKDDDNDGPTEPLCDTSNSPSVAAGILMLAIISPLLHHC